MVDCMAGECDRAVGSWYWIYFIGPFLASLAVAEVTEWINMDVGGEGEVNADDMPTEIKPVPTSDDARSVDAETLPPVDSP
jgi:hypothetical protein